MAISKTLDRYPEHFITLADRIENEGFFEILSVPKKVAENLRFQFYGFRKAAILAGLTKERFQRLPGVSVKLEPASDSAYNVQFLTAEQTDIGNLLDIALNKSNQKQYNPTADLQHAQRTIQGQIAKQIDNAVSAPQSQDSILNTFLSKDDE